MCMPLADALAPPGAGGMHAELAASKDQHLHRKSGDTAARVLEDVRSYCNHTQRTTVDFTTVVARFGHADTVTLEQ